MDRELWELMEAERRRRADRPFGDVDAITARTLYPSSRAYLEGAENLLAKASRVWRDDRPRALGYVNHVATLTFDEHEESFPAAMAASMLLFSTVVEELERALEGDSRWLEAALSVLDATDTTARGHLRDVLQAIDQDYGLTRREHRLLQAALTPIPPSAPLRDLVDIPPEELRDHVVAVLHACAAYEDALEAISGA